MTDTQSGPASTEEFADARDLKITKLGDYIGAEVTGLDLRKPLDPETRKTVYAAMVENAVLVFRSQNLDPHEYVAAVSSTLGEIMPDEDSRNRLSEEPMVGLIDSRATDKEGKRIMIGEGWHSDHVNQVRPPKFTCLYAIELPDSGGDTHFTDMRAGYDSLPEETKNRIDDMKTINVIVGSAATTGNATRKAWQEEVKPVGVEHPLVRTHPDAGTKSLYYHPKKLERIVGMTPEESQRLVQELTETAMQPQFAYDHKWRNGDLLVWDNCSVFHKAGFDYDPKQRRLLYRTMVRGEVPA